jgi:hypothetical protein
MRTGEVKYVHPNEGEQFISLSLPVILLVDCAK